MAIRRYKPEADTTITNAYKSNLTTRATGSNMGESDVLEVFNIYAQSGLSKAAVGSITVTSGTFAEGNTVEIKNSLAETTTFEFDTNGSVTGSNVAVTITGLSTAEAQLEKLADVINATLATKVTASASGNKITLTQDIAGTNGNNTTPDVTSSTTTPTIVDFTGADNTGTEQSRILIKFPTTGIVADRAASVVPASGSAKFYLRLFNVPHGETLPTNFNLEVSPLQTSWEEGHGLDMEEYSDMGASGNSSLNLFKGTGASWNVASANVDWTATGGDYDSSTIKTAEFEEGTEDLNVDITSIVEDWISTPSTNHGLIVKLTNTVEDGTNSFYTKRFSARGSEYFFKRPVIEARWDSSEKDDRNNFYAKSNLRSDADNQNVIAIKNYVDGVLTNIPSPYTAPMVAKFYTDSTKTTEITATSNNMDNDTTGVYRATVVLPTAGTSVYVVWQDSAGTPIAYHTETIQVKQHSVAIGNIPEYVTTIQNLKKVYSNDEMARFRLFIRSKDWSPTIYTVATTELKSEVVADAYYKIMRVVDDFTVIDYGSGTIPHTKLSYDENGPYFDFDMSMLETGWAYRIELMYKINGEMRQQPEAFKFRVVE